MINTLYLARHGETEWNRAGRKQGHLDSPLTERGRRQAEMLGKSLENLQIDVVFSSPLGRALSTANLAARYVGAEVVVINELAEMHHGDFGGRTSADLSGEAEWKRRAQDRYTWRFPGGESYQDLDVREKTALGSIHRYAADQALIVSHEMIGRMLFKNLCKVPAQIALSHKHPHGTVYQWEALSPETLSVFAS